MMHRLCLIVSTICLFVATVASQGIGDGLYRTAIVDSVLPLSMSDASAAGWNQDGNCDPNLGIPWSMHAAPQKTEPVTVFYTAAGQVAGVGLTMWGTPSNGFWLPTSNGAYILTVSFRDPSVMCSGDTQSYVLGDRVVINQGSSMTFDVPLNASEAAAQNWFGPGGCISHMGNHWSYDLETAPEMSWEAANLLPLLPMYQNVSSDNYEQGAINAFLITTPAFQYTEPLGDWEGPFINTLFCYNWCDPECTSFDADPWYTLHFFLHDPSENTCVSHC